MNIIASIIITILLIIVLFCLCYIGYLKIVKKHTRERFAFFSVSIMGGLVAAFVTQVISGQNFITAILTTSSYTIGTKVTIGQSDFKDYLLTAILIAFFINIIFKMHKNWDGPISEIQYLKIRYHLKTNIFKEYLLQLNDFFSKEKRIIIHNENTEKIEGRVFPDSESDKMPWYENVFELLTFSNLQYKIDLQKDYYPDEKCFISKYGLSNENIAILCSQNMPNDSSLNNFLSFCRKTNKNIKRVIVAVKNIDNLQYVVDKNDFEIEYRFENEMLESLIDFSSYQDYIERRFTKNEITLGATITLEDTYVELRAKSQEDIEINHIEKYIYDWLNQIENKHLSILGEYGCGKSVLSLKITYELLKNRTSKTRIPILIELRGKSPRNLSPGEMLSNWAWNYRLDPISLLKLHKAGKLLIIFEGFDEMDMVGDKEIRLSHFQSLWEFASSKSKIIITGRPNFFLDDKEMRINLGIDKPFDNSHYSEAIYLEKFNIEQIKMTLRNIDKNTHDQVIEILEKSNNNNFYDLVSRPAILYLVSVIWKERKLSEIKDSINSAVIISEFIKYSYSRQQSKNANFPLTEKEREYFMIGIAVGMLRSTSYSNQINKNELESIIHKLYNNFPDDILPISSATQPKLKPLKIRMADSNQAEETISTDIRSCGIIVNDLGRKDYFKFAHKSFLEYQVSLFFTEIILQNRSEYNIMMNSIANALEINTSEFTHSDETIIFTAEILSANLKLNKETNARLLAKRLFAILYPHTILKNKPKLACYYEMFSGVNSLFSLYSLLMLLSLPLFILQYNSNFKSNILSIHMIIVVCASCFLFLSFSIFRVGFSNYKVREAYRIYNRITSKRLLIWLKCCEQLNISERVIYDIIPKSYVDFLNEYKTPLEIYFYRIYITLFKRK